MVVFSTVKEDWDKNENLKCYQVLHSTFTNPIYDD